MLTDRETIRGLGMLALVFVCGCHVLEPKPMAVVRNNIPPNLIADGEPQIERGAPRPIIDGFGWVWGIPSKLMLWNRQVENHRISPETEALLAEYLATNGLNDIKVRLNQYHPLDDWKRLSANKSVGAGWRYTFGVFVVLGETIFPGRVFGSDHYNPYTNTIHLYSNVPALAIHEAGHSKDYALRKWKGTYAAAYFLPFTSLYQEAIATNDALGYVMTTGDLQAQQHAYEILYPAYGTYVGNAISGPVPGGYLIGVIGGHIAGRWKSWNLQRNYAADNDSYLHSRQPTVID